MTIRTSTTRPRAASYRTECTKVLTGLAIYGSTGPKGGIATINGTRVNFYSPTTKHRRLLYMKGWGWEAYGNGSATIKVVAKGAGGGTAMNLDAANEIGDHVSFGDCNQS